MKTILFTLSFLCACSITLAESPEQVRLREYEERLARLAPTVTCCIAFLEGEYAENKLEQALAHQEITDFINLLHEKRKLMQLLEAKQNKKAI